jgi:hypothetical protein
MDVVFNILYIFPASSERRFLCTHIAFFTQRLGIAQNQKILYKIVFSSADLELGLNIISGVRTTAKIVF